MSERQLNFSPEEVSEKNFEMAFRGYSQPEVDKFIELIAEDYRMLYKEITLLEEEISILNKLANT